MERPEGCSRIVKPNDLLRNRGRKTQFTKRRVLQGRKSNWAENARPPDPRRACSQERAWPRTRLSPDSPLGPRDDFAGRGGCLGASDPASAHLREGHQQRPEPPGVAGAPSEVALSLPLACLSLALCPRRRSKPAFHREPPFRDRAPRTV